jgi:hypothetical protein
MIINLTPHAINLPGKTIEPSGQLARCKEISRVVGNFDGIELIQRSYGEVEDLPEPQAGTLYIVSMLVRQALPDRRDLASPGDLERNETGQITGAKNLVIN